MNATARALAAGTFNSYNVRHMILSFQSILVGILVAAVLATAFSVIYVKEKVRQEVTELHNLQYQYDQMMIEQGRLLLEQNTWSSPLRIQDIAQNQLNMIAPDKSTIIFVS
jgi:cell division protein FtsL